MSKAQIPQVHFNELLTKALETNSPHYVTNLPICMLTDAEAVYVKSLIDCRKDGWTPSLDRFRQMHRFMPMVSEIPLGKLHDYFTVQRRDDYMAEEIIEHIEKNRREGLPANSGLVDLQKKLLEKTAIYNPQIIDYNTLDRTVYDTNVMRTSFYLPFFDEMTEGLNGGDFIVIMAGTKGFKTTLLKLLTERAHRKGKEDVLFCSQEQSPTAMSAQLDMQALNQMNSGLRRGISPEQMEKLKKQERIVSKLENKLFVTPQVTSVGQLHEYVLALGRPVKKIFIDGLNLMQGDSTDSYSSLQKVCSDLKKYAIEHNIVIVVVTQTNREGYKSGGAMGAQHIAGSFAISMFADLLLAMSNLEEDGRNYVYIRPILNRHGTLDVKIRFEPYRDGKPWNEFNLLDPKFGTENASNFATVGAGLKAQFEAETGMSFKEVEEHLGERGAAELLSMAAEQTTSDKIAF